jgi:hypothetical protein
METQLPLVLWSLAIFQTKHALCDFVLLARYGLRSQEYYLQRRRLIYAALHALGSVPALLLLTSDAAILGTAFAVEIVITYHLAWLHERMIPRLRDDLLLNAFLGAEQFLHQLFYLLVIALLT